MGPSSADDTYTLLLEIEALESLREELDESAVHSDADLAAQPAEEASRLQALLEEHELTSIADIGPRLQALHAQLDAIERGGATGG